MRFFFRAKNKAAKNNRHHFRHRTAFAANSCLGQRFGENVLNFNPTEMPRKRRANRSWSTHSYQKNKLRKLDVNFSVESRSNLAESDRGSWFNQGKQWPQTISSRKLGLEDSVDTMIPSSLFYSLFDINLLNKALEEATVCRLCYESVKLKERYRQGLGQQYAVVCSNENCPSHVSPVLFNSTNKNGKMFDINRVTTLAFRAIGKGRAAAVRVLSMLNMLSPLCQSTWTSHTKELADICKDLMLEELQSAVVEVQESKRTEEKHARPIVDAGATFDGSWCGWSARDGVVAAISIDTGKVLDVAHLSRSCITCDKLKEKNQKGELSLVNFLKIYCKHDER